ncbi:MAG: pyridoxamine 5'-phosphate oxidase family protein [Saccharospirillaceae bacterium]|nr:pyridoxamine 5'-phosphate oxidase family protein [Pseudomonadales bacterium]NRB77561.1 pyridoxamine 5'-phosphate oxidase family protein [Saccharospirillaceae bacterium]
MIIESEQQLRAIYGFAKGRAVDKQLSELEFHSKNFINHSPFVLLSTYSKNAKVDCSPRGGELGFVKIVDNNKIIIADSKGNNRLDSLVNIIETKQIGCLFLIPGVDETLRVNGSALISTAPEYLDLFVNNKQIPKSCIEITINEVFLHCAKALMRSKLWSEALQLQRSDFPSMGQMINDQLGLNEKIESQTDMVSRYIKDI